MKKPSSEMRSIYHLLSRTGQEWLPAHALRLLWAIDSIAAPKTLRKVASVLGISLGCIKYIVERLREAGLLQPNDGSASLSLSCRFIPA